MRVVFSRLINLLQQKREELPSANLKRSLLSFLLLFSFVFKLLFVFRYSNYANYLVSDMGFYWQRAHDRFQGHFFGTDQWYANPPFFPMFLEQIFKVLSFLGLSQYELAAVLSLFIVLSTLSVLGVFKIAVILSGGFWRAFGAASLYAFCYPMMYFNMFVLTENLAIPLLILVFWLVLSKEGSLGWMFSAGLLFGAACAIRVALGPIGFFIFLYLWAARPVSWFRFRRAAVFSGAFFLVIFFLLVENFFISKGELRGLAGYFGFNVFLQYCKVRNAYSGTAFYNNPTFIGHHPEFGVFHTDHPFNDRPYFFDLVRFCIDNNPHIWIDNLKLFKDIFLYPPWPFFSEVPGCALWMPLFTSLTLLVTLSLGLFYWVAARERLVLSRMSLILSPLFCALIMGYFFGMEGRLLIPGLFGLYILLFSQLPRCLKQIKKSLIYFSILGLILGLFFMGSQMKRKSLEKLYGVSSIQTADLSEASLRVPDATPGDQLGFFIMPTVKSGILLRSPSLREAREIEISTDSYDSYEVRFYDGKKMMGSLTLPIERPLGGGTYKRLLRIPQAMTGKKFDRILVKPLAGDGFYSLAYLILDPIGEAEKQKLYGVTRLQEIPLSRMSHRAPDASSGDRFGFVVMPDLQSGVLLLLESPREARTIEISTDSFDSYRVEFFLKDKKRGELVLPRVEPPKGGIYARMLDLPSNMAGKKFDKILVRPVQGDGFYSLAYLILDPV